MITSISKLKSFGVFQEYKAAKDLKHFVQYNVFYGWNGSGKSTLAKFFLSITDKKIHPDFPDGEFSIAIKDCPDLTHKNLLGNKSNVKVFSRDFIDRNVNFEQSKANSILILSEEKKEEMEKYKAILAELLKQEGTYRIDDSAYTKAVEDLKKELSKWASNVKKSFELIETSNTYYLNYDRTKLNNFIKTNRSKIVRSSVLSQDAVRNLKNAIKPNQKPNINVPADQIIDLDGLKKRISEIEAILSTSIFSKQIERLTSHPEINLWVKEGLAIHAKYDSKNCEYCGLPMPEKRIEEINNHFSKEYDQLTSKIKYFYDEIIKLLEDVDNKPPDTGDFYDELHSEFDPIRHKLTEAQAKFSSILEELKKLLEDKDKNPFSIINFKVNDIEEEIIEYNKCRKNVADLIAKHNLKNQGFDDAVKKAQGELELHFVCEILINEEYEDTEKAIKAKKDALDEKSIALEQLRSDVKALEAILINEAVGAENFNKNLEKFIGRKDISLEFDRGLKGYKLMRKGRTQPAKNLSEGEKTAIAFVYFVSKLKENGNQIEDSIIVLDDPISSFDSNHLFHSYSYLKQECEKAQQLFILTHNFQYFKLIRDWLQKKNERKKKSDGAIEEKIRTNFYSVDCTAEEDRKATINNANSTLLDYNSEYHYIFYKLLTLRDIATLDLEKAFLIANLSRKLLEGFLTFKFPKGRNDFSQLLQDGCPDPEVREKVYRFINKYSHNQVIDFSDGPIDNLLGEGNNIVTSVLKIVEDLDKAHYTEMSEVCA
jgi:wobble nucleotide-excising tRNase